MIRRLAGAIVTAALLAPSPVSAADQQFALFAYRTTAGAAALDLQIDAPPGARPSVLAVVMASIDDSRIAGIELASVVLSGDADRAHVRANGRRTALCDNGMCVADVRTQTAGSAISIRNSPGDARLNALFVVARGQSVSHRISKIHGWAVKRVVLPSRVVSGSDAAEVGAYALGSGAEAFTETRSPGGRTGSIAVSEPPCSEAGSGVVSRGVGTLTLEGGLKDDTFTCPIDHGALSSWTYRATTWRVSGTAAGDTTMAGARLFVLDLPKTLPVPRKWPWR